MTTPLDSQPPWLSVGSMRLVRYCKYYEHMAGIGSHHDGPMGSMASCPAGPCSIAPNGGQGRSEPFGAAAGLPQTSEGSVRGGSAQDPSAAAPTAPSLSTASDSKQRCAYLELHGRLFMIPTSVSFQYSQLHRRNCAPTRELPGARLRVHLFSASRFVLRAG